jgi:hypothetical protein
VLENIFVGINVIREIRRFCKSKTENAVDKAWMQKIKRGS